MEFVYNARSILSSLDAHLPGMGGGGGGGGCMPNPAADEPCWTVVFEGTRRVHIEGMDPGYTGDKIEKTQRGHKDGEDREYI